MATKPRYAPPTMYLTFNFNPACEQCRGLMVKLTDQAVREPRITGWRVTKSAAHLHEVTEQTPLEAPRPAASDVLFEMPRSDVNGFDPDL